MEHDPRSKRGNLLQRYPGATKLAAVIAAITLLLLFFRIPKATLQIRNEAGQPIEVVRFELDGEPLLRGELLIGVRGFTVFFAGQPATLTIEVRRQNSGRIARCIKIVRQGEIIWTEHRIWILPAKIYAVEGDMDVGSAAFRN
jgi:hypothetical protein